MKKKTKFSKPSSAFKLASINCSIFIEFNAFLNIGIKSGLAGGTRLIIFLENIWLVSAEFKKNTERFRVVSAYVGWLRVVSARFVVSMF